MNDIIGIIIQFVIVLFAISIHEASHAYAALKCGDPTARDMGRVTLNPVAHIDPIGTILFPIILAIMGAPVFGWAKPVQVNPMNFRDYRRGNMIVSAAGPASNIAAGIGGVLLFKILQGLGIMSQGIGIFLFYLVLINIYLAIFNLIPIPPLDGSGILESRLRGEALAFYRRLRPYGFLILIAIIYLGVLDLIARPIIRMVGGLFGLF